MPRSTTAWLMASVSVACSAIRPIHINNRLIALNIGLLSVVWCLLLLHRFFLFEENLALEDILQLCVKLLLIRRADHRRADLFDRVKSPRPPRKPGESAGSRSPASAAPAAGAGA